MYKMYLKLKFKKVLGGKQCILVIYTFFLANIQGDTGWLSPTGIQS